MPTLEVNKINNHNPDLFIINHLDQPLEAKISYQWPAIFLPEEELTSEMNVDDDVWDEDEEPC